MGGNIWTVPAAVLRVVDADTLVLKLDLGWHITYESRCRLIGINAPELSTDEGQAAKRWVRERLGFDDLGQDVLHTIDVTFVSHALDKYGRPLGQVLVTTEQGESFDLGLELMNAGHAVPMAG